MEALIPLVALLIWLGLGVYVLILATRLVTAVEQIARTMKNQE